jgi:hypothetical protein
VLFWCMPVRDCRGLADDGIVHTPDVGRRTALSYGVQRSCVHTLPGVVTARSVSDKLLTQVSPISSVPCSPRHLSPVFCMLGMRRRTRSALRDMLEQAHMAWSSTPSEMYWPRACAILFVGAQLEGSLADYLEAHAATRALELSRQVRLALTPSPCLSLARPSRVCLFRAWSPLHALR